MTLALSSIPFGSSAGEGNNSEPLNISIIHSSVELYHKGILYQFENPTLTRSNSGAIEGMVFNLEPLPDYEGRDGFFAFEFGSPRALNSCNFLVVLYKTLPGYVRGFSVDEDGKFQRDPTTNINFDEYLQVGGRLANSPVTPEKLGDQHYKIDCSTQDGQRYFRDKDSEIKATFEVVIL